MPTQLEISFRDLEPSVFTAQRIREHARDLEEFADHIIRCHVTVGSARHPERRGDRYVVDVDVWLRAGEHIVGRGHRAEHAHEGLGVALRDAFADLAQRLRAHLRAGARPPSPRSRR